jgi:hypothetical protein
MMTATFADVGTTTRGERSQSAIAHEPTLHQPGTWRSQYGVDAHRKALDTPLGAVLADLERIMGLELLAHAVATDRDVITKWLSGSLVPDRDQEERLRNVYLVAAMIDDVDGSETVRAWMIGMNDWLGDNAPVVWLHDGNSFAVAQAAESFVLDD